MTFLWTQDFVKYKEAISGPEEALKIVYTLFAVFKIYLYFKGQLCSVNSGNVLCIWYSSFLFNHKTVCYVKLLVLVYSIVPILNWVVSTKPKFCIVNGRNVYIMYCWYNGDFSSWFISNRVSIDLVIYNTDLMIAEFIILCRWLAMFWNA